MELTDKGSKSAHEAFDKIAGAAHQSAETFCEKGEQLKNAEKQLMKNCRGYVGGHPMASLGIAVAAGFLLSRLLSSR